MTDRPQKLPQFAQIKVFQTATNPKTGETRSGYNVSEIPDSLIQYGFNMFKGAARGYLNGILQVLCNSSSYLLERCNRPEQYTNATKPNPTDVAKGFGPGSMIYITDIDGVGQSGIAFSDGTNWRKVKDNSIV
jgi:hypothetical protein